MLATNEELATRIKAGEREHLAQLWGQIRKLIILFANRYRHLQERYAFVDENDFIQCGYFAMLKAIEAFDTAKGFKFTSYLHFYYRNEIYKMLGCKGGKRELPPPCASLNKALNEDSDTELLEMLEDEESGGIADHLEEEEIKLILADAIKRLSGKQPAIIKGIFFEDKTLAQLAEELDFSHSERVRQIKVKALQRLRAMPALREVYYISHYEPTPPPAERTTPESIAIFNESWESWRKNLEKEMERLRNGL